MRASQAISASVSTCRPASAMKLASASVARGGTRWVTALRVASTTAGRSKPCASAASVAMRAAAISGLGETRS